MALHIASYRTSAGGCVFAGMAFWFPLMLRSAAEVLAIDFIRSPAIFASCRICARARCSFLAGLRVSRSRFSPLRKFWQSISYVRPRYSRVAVYARIAGYPRVVEYPYIAEYPCVVGYPCLAGYLCVVIYPCVAEYPCVVIYPCIAV